MKKRSKEQVTKWLFELGEKAYKMADNAIDRAKVFRDLIYVEYPTTRFLTEELTEWVMKGDFENLRYRIRKAREKSLQEKAVNAKGRGSNKEYKPHSEIIDGGDTTSVLKPHKLSEILKTTLLECIDARKYESAKSIIDAIAKSEL